MKFSGEASRAEAKRSVAKRGEMVGSFQHGLNPRLLRSVVLSVVLGLVRKVETCKRGDSLEYTPILLSLLLTEV